MSQRVMLKVSGEQLESEEYNFDLEYGNRVADVVLALTSKGYSVACVMGGGNVVRGGKLYSNGFTNKVIADQMGMLATIQNGLFLAEVLKQRGVEDPYLVSNLPVESISDRFSYKKAIKHLNNDGKVMLISGGLGKPGFTTDTGVVAQAFELHCPIVIKTTKVDGVYSSDPVIDKSATRYETLSFKEALENENIRVMDRAAIAFAADKNITIGICKPDPESVLALLNGDTTKGTLVQN